MANDEMPPDADMEAVRRGALRVFAVTLIDGRVEQVFAHFHDAGTGPGHLSFVTIESDGRQVISRVFNVHLWEELREVTTADQQTRGATARLHVVRRQEQIDQQRNPDVKPPASSKKQNVH